MPQTEVVIYTEEDGTAPLVGWLDSLPKKAQDKCMVRIQRLASRGHELRRPNCDYLRDGIYELRFAYHHVNYRVLYFFDGKRAVLSHGIVKERRVPDREIDLAVRRKQQWGGRSDQ